MGDGHREGFGFCSKHQGVLGCDMKGPAVWRKGTLATVG